MLSFPSQVSTNVNTAAATTASANVEHAQRPQAATDVSLQSRPVVEVDEDGEPSATVSAEDITTEQLGQHHQRFVGIINRRISRVSRVSPSKSNPRKYSRGSPNKINYIAQIRASNNPAVSLAKQHRYGADRNHFRYVSNFNTIKSTKKVSPVPKNVGHQQLPTSSDGPQSSANEHVFRERGRIELSLPRLQSHMSVLQQVAKSSKRGTGDDAERRVKHVKVKVDQDVFSERWIVVTSINYPTVDVRKLASIPGWKVVVVGDLKTPKDWR